MLTRCPAPSGARIRGLIALLWVLPLYWLVIFPRTRREIHLWVGKANAIADPVLRGHALGKLHSERLVIEGASAFAILAVARHRSSLIRACVAFEVIYDFVDAVGEESVDDVLAHNRALNRALLAAVQPLSPHENHYAHFPGREDGGYLHALIDACRLGLVSLPTNGVALAALQRLATIAGEAQTLNHTGLGDGHVDLEMWAESFAVSDARWWEVAAAASSPLGIFALLAAASHDGTSLGEVTAIDHAYFPWIGAVVWLLESLVDIDDDLATGNHNYVANYVSRDEAARRLVTLVRRAASAANSLPQSTRHTLLLAGAAATYLSTAQARDAGVRHVARAIRRSIGGPIVPLLLMLRVRRLVAGSTAEGLRRASSYG